MAVCRWCNRPLPTHPAGRRPDYCSPACAAAEGELRRARLAHAQAVGDLARARRAVITFGILGPVPAVAAERVAGCERQVNEHRRRLGALEDGTTP